MQKKMKIKEWASKPQIVKWIQLLLTALIPTFLSFLYSYEETQKYFNLLGIGWNITIIVVVGFIMPIIGNFIYENYTTKKNKKRYNAIF